MSLFVLISVVIMLDPVCAVRLLLYWSCTTESLVIAGVCASDLFGTGVVFAFMIVSTAAPQKMRL